MPWTTIENDTPKKLRVGWTIQEEIGIVVINDYAIARVSFNNDGMGREEPTLDREENALNNYLSMMCNLKEERCIEKLREQIPHYSIMWLEVD